MVTALAYRATTVLDHPAAAVAAALVPDLPAVLHLTLDHHQVPLVRLIHQAHLVPVVH